MYNATNLKLIDGGIKIKQGDKSSNYSFELQDENEKAINLDDKNATVLLVKDGEVKYKKVVKVSGSIVSFTIDKFLEVGKYPLEIHCDGYVFPSNDSIKINVVKSFVSEDTPEEETEGTFIGLGKIQIDEKYTTKAKEMLDEYFTQLAELPENQIPTENEFYKFIMKHNFFRPNVFDDSIDYDVTPEQFSSIISGFFDTRNFTARKNNALYINMLALSLYSMDLNYKYKPFFISLDKYNYEVLKEMNLTRDYTFLQRLDGTDDFRMVGFTSMLAKENSPEGAEIGYNWEIVSDSSPEGAKMEIYGSFSGYYSSDYSEKNGRTDGENFGLIIPIDEISRKVVVRCTTTTGLSADLTLNIEALK